MSSLKRALHFVLKIGNLKKNIEFFRDTLGMTVLRHEVFDEGCEAACNGPYSTKWSKTMIGYGPEDDYFVLELTYNYSIGGYKRGNDLQYIKMFVNDDVFERAKGETKSENTDELNIESPDGYKFIVAKNKTPTKQDVSEVCLSCKSLEQSLKYWVNLLGMKKSDSESCTTEALLRYSENQAGLRLKQIVEDVDHKSGYGRIAFSCPSSELKPIQKAAEEAARKVLTPFLSLDTPGKATVQVVILADPDDHEICFVGDEGFRELSKFDPQANELLEASIKEDKSEEWFSKKKGGKTEV